MVKVVSEIKNKIKREEEYNKQRSEKNRAKLLKRQNIQKMEKLDPNLKQERLAANVPKTIESTREPDETMILDNDEEVAQDEETDEYAQYFNSSLVPKILVTTSRRPSANIWEFAQEFVSILPDAQFVKRGSQFEIKKIVEIAIKREFTDVIILNEDCKKPNALTIIHLPDGPTAEFKLTSILTNKEIHGHGRMTAHKPELILNNFNTRLGHTVGRMFASLFPQVPEFKGRQVCTLHNQRDFIFFRRHRYIFNEEQKKCTLQELGPRFTLKLRSLQKGTFDTKFGEYEWVNKPDMETSRRKFFL